MNQPFSIINKALQSFNNTQNSTDFREGFFQDFLKKSENSEHYRLYQILQEYDLQSKIDFLQTSIEDPFFDKDKQHIQEFLKKIENLTPEANPNITPRNVASTPTDSEVKSTLKTKSILTKNRQLHPETNPNIRLRRNASSATDQEEKSILNTKGVFINGNSTGASSESDRSSSDSSEVIDTKNLQQEPFDAMKSLVQAANNIPLFIETSTVSRANSNRKDVTTNKAEDGNVMLHTRF